MKRNFLKTANLLLVTALLLMTVFTAVFAEEPDPILVLIDRTKPELTISKYEYEGDNLIITGTAYDALSGIIIVEGRTSAGTYVNASDFEVGPGGTWKYIYDLTKQGKGFDDFYFRATDNAGNSSDEAKRRLALSNKAPMLLLPDTLYVDVPVVPEKVPGKVGEATSADITIHGLGYGPVSWDLKYPDFEILWNGYFDNVKAPEGTYTVTVRTRDDYGNESVTNAQIIASSSSDKDKKENENFNVIDIFGVVDSISDTEIVINGQHYKITGESNIDPSIKAGDRVSGLGKYMTATGEMIVTSLTKVPEKKNLPTIEVEKDEKTGEESFTGIIDSIGDDYIIVDGVLINTSDITEWNCDKEQFKVGDYVSGVIEVYSKSGNFALNVNKASCDDEKMHTENIVGRVSGMGDGWIEINDGAMHFDLTDSVIVNGEYKIGDIVMIEVLQPDNEVLSITVLGYAECTDKLAYYYGHLDGIMEDTGEFVVDGVIHVPSETMLIDEYAGAYETDAYAALVDLNCKSLVVRTVQNAGNPDIENDAMIGTVKSVDEPDVNSNTPVYINDRYTFMNRYTDTSADLHGDQFVVGTKVGDELVSVTEVNDAAINTDDLVDFAGSVNKITGLDNKSNYFIMVDGVSHRVLKSSVIDETVGKMEKGALVSGTELDGDILHIAVIRQKEEGINSDNAFIGKLTEVTNTEDPDRKALTISGKHYITDKNTLQFSDLAIDSVVVGTHENGVLLTLRDLPAGLIQTKLNTSSGMISEVSKKEADGSYTITLNGEVFTMSAVNVPVVNGYVAQNMPVVAVYDSSTHEIVSIFVDNNIPQDGEISALTGELSYIGLPDEQNNYEILVDGFSYQVNAATIVNEELKEGDSVLFTVSNGNVVTIARLQDGVRYASPEIFSNAVSYISDTQSDGSYIVTLGDQDLALTSDTLLNDVNSLLNLEIVVTGVKFGNMVYAASTFGGNEVVPADVAFSGVLEDIEKDASDKVTGLNVDGTTYPVYDSSVLNENVAIGRIITGSMKQSGEVVSAVCIIPKIGENDIITFSGTVDSVSATDDRNYRTLIVDESRYVITPETHVVGDIVDGARITGFSMLNDKLISLTVLEPEDLGQSIEGTVENVSTTTVSDPDNAGKSHIMMGGFYDLVTKNTALISGEPAVKDRVYGYYYGHARDSLAIDKLSFIDIFKGSTAMKFGAGGIGALLLGTLAAFGIGNKKKYFKGILNLVSDDTISITDPDDPTEVKEYKLAKDMYDSAQAMAHRTVTGYSKFGRVVYLDIVE